ncbi:MAG: ABC transporter ATP-binding protein [Planctomycetaceae bacterium]
MKYFPRIFRYLRPYWGLAIAVVVIIALASATDLLAPWPLKILVDNALGDEPAPQWLQALVPAVDRYSLLILAVAAGLAVALIYNVINVLNEYFQTKLQQLMVLDFRSDLFQHAQHLSMAYHDQRRSGMLIYIVNGQGDAVAGMIMIVPTIAQSLITLLGMFWIVFLIDPGMALLSMAVVPFLFYSIRYYATHIQDRLMRVKKMEGESLSIVHEAFSMMRVIVAFGREPHEHQRFRNQGERAINARVDVTVRQTLFSLAVNMTTAIGTAGVLGLGAYRVLEGRLTIGHLLVVMSYIAAVYKPLEAIANTLGSLQEKLISQRIAFGILDSTPDVQEVPRPLHLARCRGRVVYENVSFHYRGRLGTLRHISFEAEPGQRVAVVGPTGAGKTTLVSLLPRFYDANQGRILLDGQDIRELTLRSLRDQISFVLQEPLLFSATVAENIRYGRLDATDEEVIEAASAANAHDFVTRLPEGYDTPLGERGARLSGGERQRLCIARAFLKDAPILILDEPTSSVDVKTELVILEALDRLMAGRTSFLIAHRMSTIRDVDSILVLDRGELVQRGTHADLMLQDGLYKHFQEMQSWQGKRLSRPGLPVH